MKVVRYTVAALIAVVTVAVAVWAWSQILEDGASDWLLGSVIVAFAAGGSLGVAALIATDRASTALLLALSLAVINGVFWLIAFWWLPVSAAALLGAGVVVALERRQLRLARQWRPS